MDDGLHEHGGDYYMDVREFEGGSIEAVVKQFRPGFEGRIRESADPESHVNFLKSKGLSYNEVYGNGLKRIRRNPDEIDPWEKAENHKRAVRRAKQSIRFLTKQVEADRLLTLTYRKNQEDRGEVKADFARFLRLVRKGWAGQGGDGDWRYIAVLERQERGAYHIHCAVKGHQRIPFLRTAWFKALGGRGNETGEQTPGNIDVTSPHKARWGTKRSEWKASKLSAYLTKYLSKTFDESTAEKRRYWHSKGIESPKKERFLLCATSMVGAINEIKSILELNYGMVIDFSRSWMGAYGETLWLSLGEFT
jgi:hypothetical protein